LSVVAWRICKAARAADIWTGAGARDYGGRWNSKGTAVVYTSESLSLAALEVLVHLGSDEVLRKFVKCSAEIDERLIFRVDTRTLPSNWRDEPAPLQLRAIGDAWVAAASSAVLAVPSVLVPEEWNYLLNPAHIDFAKIVFGKPTSFRFGSRLA
jgi:RES domain-containing protein